MITHEDDNRILNTLNSLKVYSNILYDLLEALQATDEFQNNVESEIRGYFYHSYIKCKRNFKAINILINSKEIENGYIESIPLLRSMVEGYFHLCYITDSKHRQEALEAYERLNKYQLKQMLRDDRGYRMVMQGDTDKKLVETIKEAVEPIKRSHLKPFNDIYKFAKKTGNEIIYNHIYTKFNSYVHFNPTTFVSYGSTSEVGIFNFERFEFQPLKEAEILYYSISVMIQLYSTTLNYLGIRKVNKDTAEKIEDWVAIKESYKHIMSS